MKVQEFLNLKQGDRTVAEYARDFSRLSHYTGSLLTTLERIEVEGTAKKGSKEKEKGGKIIGQAPDSGLGKRKHFERSSSRKSGRGRSSRQRLPRPSQQTSRGTTPVRTYETCGKVHGGVCYKAIGACYNCGGTIHFARDCVSARKATPPTTVEGSVQSSTSRGSQTVSKGRGIGRGSTFGSQTTVNQPEQSGAPARVYTMW
ncbi:uncharacterized protein LOC110643814 [Hevea brasiliensis]|uniref:uncharacterized protein LOC110643814 n=1 Tax=Hevea brasiliensis TaxID=3981 RepID=UPI0025CEF68A|nr:uncharacterized protein LOC110643814 [Hevea brasiliensis]